jgi:hypothetical protein
MMKRVIALIAGLIICFFILGQCARRKLVTIHGKVSSVGYVSLAKDRNMIEFHSIEIQSEGNSYDCKFAPADAETVLGKPLAEKLLVPDPDHETNQLILTDEPLLEKVLMATLADPESVGQNRFVATLVKLDVKE